MNSSNYRIMTNGVTFRVQYKYFHYKSYGTFAWKYLRDKRSNVLEFKTESDAQNIINQHKEEERVAALNWREVI